MVSGPEHPQWVDGRTTHPLLGTWHMMKTRCYNRNHVSYEYYGARGVTVCPRWRLDFWAFVKDMGDRPEGRTLDRIDRDGSYGPLNCQWATPSEQARNRKRRHMRTACMQGHPFDEENTYQRSDGTRACKTCQRARDRARNPR